MSVTKVFFKAIFTGIKFVSKCFLVILLVTGIYNWYYYKKKSNVPNLVPKSSRKRYIRFENVGFKVKHVYDDIRSNKWPHGSIGFVYVPVDLEIIKNILTKDFDYFGNRLVFSNADADPLSINMFTLNGPRWRSLRVKLTPSFTSGRMKKMFSTLTECGNELLQRTKDHLQQKKGPIDAKETLGCYTTDTIGTCAFGLECDSFREDNALFRKYARDFFFTSPSKIFKLAIAFVSLPFARFLGISYTSRELTQFFIKCVDDTVTFRKTSNFRRPDFIQSMIDLKDENSLTVSEIAGQCFNFFAAGFEPTSTTMTFALYEISRVPDFQNRVRNEILENLRKYNDDVCYEAIQGMKFLDQIVLETLRKYPPVPFLTRGCTRDYQFDNDNDNIIIKEGTPVFVSVLGIHHDPEYYPEPEKFDPERFSDENKRSRHTYAFIPFGEGPRSCIGARFGMLQIKVGLVMLLKKYKFSINSKTKEPIVIDPTSVAFTILEGMWLNVEKI